MYTICSQCLSTSLLILKIIIKIISKLININKHNQQSTIFDGLLIFNYYSCPKYLEYTENKEHQLSTYTRLSLRNDISSLITIIGIHNTMQNY